MTDVFQEFVQWQVRLSRAFDRLLPAIYRVDGYQDFQNRFVPPYLSQGQLIYDVGGGKSPFLSQHTKDKLGVRVIGLDIDPQELTAAPAGAYDGTFCVDITRFRGSEDADVTVCAALLEHVSDTQAAIAAIQSVLKPGGIALLFVPSRNAVYARINLIIPHRLKQRILYYLFPETSQCQGFRAHYDRCTLGDFRLMAKDNGFEVLEFKPYFVSTYFSFFFPLYVVWRLWMLIFNLLCGDQAAETFSLALRKVSEAPTLTPEQSE